MPCISSIEFDKIEEDIDAFRFVAPTARYVSIEQQAKAMVAISICDEDKDSLLSVRSTARGHCSIASHRAKASVLLLSKICFLETLGI